MCAAYIGFGRGAVKMSRKDAKHAKESRYLVYFEDYFSIQPSPTDDAIAVGRVLSES